ncbi:MAG: MGMT family protein [Proteobacteria bacterium]|nr:MGMT family protein [Pseudomonadota bacterium]
MGGRDARARIYAAVRRIPRGRVATYGQIAEMAGLGRHARLVGYALAAIREQRLPWHRVINARGEVSPRARSEGQHEQRARLEAEGIVFGPGGRVDLGRYRWRPRVQSGDGD